ncbi:MAG: TetR/AcrR family transcriptional regulator [Deltaproteobacteria bacterium]|nr:TetR/AcrR family transcriptional regulator [Deltaproteobacteria bacterium]
MRTRGPGHADTKQRILEVARKLVIKQGHANLSLRAVAREAGFSAPSLYEYFASKDEIVATIAGEIAASLRRALHEAATEAKDPRAALLAIGLAYVAWARKHPQDFLLMFSRLPSRRRALTAAPPSESPYQIVVAAVTQAHEAGVITGKPQRREHIAYALWAAVHGMAMLQLTHLAGFDADFATADKAAVEALIAGFGA